MRANVAGHIPEYSERIGNFIHLGGLRYVAMLVVVMAIGAVQVFDALQARDQLQATREELQQWQEGLADAQANLALSQQMLSEAEETPPPTGRHPYIVISLYDRRLWYKKEGNTLMTTRVATGSGKRLIKEGGSSTWKFDTPRGRLSVVSKEENPLWVPPDWFYVEQARKKHLGLMHLQHGQTIPLGDGSAVKVAGADVVRVYPDGHTRVLRATEEHHIILNGRILVPPMETNQRRFDKVLGTHRLNLGHGYGLHGTNQPDSVGRAVSHGCVRLHNEDIAKLYQMVPIGTPVYLY
ncbi:L,D-transpeptidase [Geomesophilobacter sediminis]|uniref:L,D-transpeptidase n=1 Tax=Geomesophilobacter sediminis TaxID=2798584 RepID=A0A8J7J6S6_9BACT|nr:L,D-transpeptidase [Geomesophilobacter sediminis]MBJ6724586.1 L,D-transpeptidase [Geomesophilobacter sediminis]